MNKPIYIHAGAHRTGTSSFQQCLHENATVLQDRGFDTAYPGRDGTPDGKLRMRLPGPRHAGKDIQWFAEDLKDHLHALSPQQDRGLILSEENISGRMFHFYQGQFFPASDMRITSLSNALPCRPKHVILVLRSYDELFISAYRKRAEDNEVLPFADLAPKFLAMKRGWPDLVQQMRDILQPERMSVLPYERRGESRALLARLVPELALGDLVEPQETLNQSATDAALLDLQSRYCKAETLERPQWQAIVQSHADDIRELGFAAFSAADQEALMTRYQIDLVRIAELDGVNFM